jgi:hypothetical protein
MRREPVKGGTVLISNLLFNFLLIAYNSSRGLRNRRAYACRFPGIVPAWGRQNRRREHSLNPLNSTAAILAVLHRPYLQRRCQTIKSFK